MCNGYQTRKRRESSGRQNIVMSLRGIFDFCRDNVDVAEPQLIDHAV